jgi:hypothetical protein
VKREGYNSLKVILITLLWNQLWQVLAFGEKYDEWSQMEEGRWIWGILGGSRG